MVNVTESINTVVFKESELTLPDLQFNTELKYLFDLLSSISASLQHHIAFGFKILFHLVLFMMFACLAITTLAHFEPM